MRSASLFLLVIALVSFLPRSAGALPTIIISEVAWMGTTLDGGKTSQAARADEWIECKNAGLAPVDLAGSVLRSATDDGGPVITLSGSIPAGGFFLLERTDDGAVPPPADWYGSFGNGLSNTGETLELRDNQGALVDAALWTDNGPGDAATKQTMERRADGTWASSAFPGGTPKTENSVWDSPPPPPPQPSPDPPAPSPTPPQENTPAPPQENQSASSPVTAGAITLRLSELLPDPEGKDGEGEFVEVQNYGSEPVTLNDWKIQDASGRGLTLSGIIAAGTYVAFRAADVSLPTLNNDGDTITLHDPSGNLRDGVAFSGTVEGLALIRVGEQWQWTSTPTPNAPNILATPKNDGAPAQAVVLAAPPIPAAAGNDGEDEPRSAVDTTGITARKTADGNELAAALRNTGEEKPLSPLVPAAATAILAFFVVLGARIFAKRRSAPSFIVDGENEE